jgi:hypothetical protein
MAPGFDPRVRCQDPIARWHHRGCVDLTVCGAKSDLGWWSCLIVLSPAVFKFCTGPEDPVLSKTGRLQKTAYLQAETIHQGFGIECKYGFDLFSNLFNRPTQRRVRTGLRAPPPTPSLVVRGRERQGFRHLAFVGLNAVSVTLQVHLCRAPFAAREHAPRRAGEPLHGKV